MSKLLSTCGPNCDEYCFLSGSPLAPEISVASVTSTNASFTWTQPTIGTETVDSYRVVVRSVPIGCVSDNTTEHILNGTERSLEVVDLEEFSEVTITVTARNGQGESSATNVTNTLATGMYQLHT